MNSLPEIEAAIEQLPSNEAQNLLKWLQNYLDESKKKSQKELSLAEAVEVMRHHYESGSDLAMITESDSEGFYEYEDYA